MLYLSIILSKKATPTPTKKSSFLARLFTKFWFFIPKANPDYGHLIHNVTTWLLEFNDETLYPEREIGLDGNGNVIIIMPFGKNSGFWIDSNLYYDDFKPPNFNVKNISEEYFENHWRLIDTNTCS